MSVERPVLRYHGGKWKLAPWIIANMPQHRIYVEPFGGGASVLMRKPRSYAEVYNDKWDSVVNVFAVLRDAEKSEALRAAIALTPFSRKEFDACSAKAIEGISDPVERARRTVFRSLAGFGSGATNGRYATGFRCNSNRSGTVPSHDWANCPKSIRDFVERLAGVVIENREAVDVVQQHDRKDTLFFVDPPYVHSTRNMQRGNAAYKHEMSDGDHRSLAAVLRGVTGMVMLSGYPCEMYEELYGDWQCLEREAFADGARNRTECLWFNAAAWSRRPQIELMEAMAWA